MLDKRKRPENIGFNAKFKININKENRQDRIYSNRRVIPDSNPCVR